MNDPLFKTLREPLNPEEEAELTQRLADAYCQTEEAVAQPVFERIQQKISERLALLKSSPTKN